MIRGSRVLHLDFIEPGVLTRGLVEVAMDADITHGNRVQVEGDRLQGGKGALSSCSLFPVTCSLFPITYRVSPRSSTINPEGSRKNRLSSLPEPTPIWVPSGIRLKRSTITPVSLTPVPISA